MARYNSSIKMTFDSYLDHVHKGCKLYSDYADTDLMFVFRHGKNGNYDYEEIHFGKRNFMHLVGLKSKERCCSAEEFFDFCLNDDYKQKINKQNFVPTSNWGTTYDKGSVIEKSLDFKYSKLYKIGDKDLITRDNDFDVATGNRECILGFKKIMKSTIPVTLLANDISQYCSKLDKIMFVFQKEKGKKTYNKLFYEIKKELIKKEIKEFSDSLISKIDEKYLESILRESN